MKPAVALMIGLVAAAPAAAGEHADPRVALQREGGAVAVDRAPAASLLAARPAVRIFARHPRPEFAPLATAPTPRPRPAPVVETVDDSAFWRAAGAGEAATAEREFGRLTASLAPWPAAGAARAVLDRLAFDAAMSAAVANGNWSRIVTLRNETSGRFTCAEVGNLWTLAEAHRQRREIAGLASVYTTIIERCGGDDAVLALRRSAAHLPAEQVKPILAAATAGPDREIAAAAMEITYDLNRAAIIAAFDASDDAEVRRLTGVHAPEITTRRDAEAALFAAWSAERTADYPLARTWFDRALTWQPSAAAANGVVAAALRDGDLVTAERVAAAHLTGSDATDVGARITTARATALSDAGDDAAVVALARQSRRDNTAGGDLLVLAGYANLRLGDPAAAAADFDDAVTAGAGDPARFGQARALLALDDLDGADAIVGGLLPAAEAVAIAAEIDMRRANTAFAAKDFQAALGHAQGAQRNPDLSLAALELEAWSLFNMRQYGAAAELFENLYQVAPSEGVADGLYASLTTINRQARLRRIAAEIGGPLERRLRWQGVAE